MNKYFLLFILFGGFSLLAESQTRDLDYYLKAGLSNSPLLKDYNNQFNAVSYDSLLLKAEKKPQIEARSQLLYSPAYKKFGYDEVVTDGGNYQAVVSVSQDVFARKEVNNRIESLKLQKESIKNSRRISMSELKKIITEQYLSSYSIYSDILFNKAFLDLIYRENEIVKQLVSTGIYKQTDYLSLIVETQTQEILISQLTGEFNNSLRELNRLCGIDDPASFALLLPNLVPGGKPEIEVSPLYAQYYIDSLRIANEKSAIDVKYRLKVNWFADAGFLTSTPWNFYNHFGYSAGLNLSIPIYDGHQKEVEKQKLDLSENTRGNYKSNFRRQYSQQTIQLYDELKSLEEIQSRLEKQASTSEQLIAALRSGLESGIIQMTEYISAIKNFRFINKSLNDNTIKILQVINELNFLATQ